MQINKSNPHGSDIWGLNQMCWSDQLPRDQWVLCPWTQLLDRPHPDAFHWPTGSQSSVRSYPPIRTGSAQPEMCSVAKSSPAPWTCPPGSDFVHGIS